jgi:hypothetical protein
LGKSRKECCPMAIWPTKGVCVNRACGFDGRDCRSGIASDWDAGLGFANDNGRRGELSEGRRRESV